MKRSGPIKRRTRLPRSTTPMRPRQSPLKAKKRSASEFARIYGSRRRVIWVKQQACVSCGAIGWSDNAHVCGGDGASRKGHYTTIVPLCRDRFGTVGCHTKFDQRKAPFNNPAVREMVRAHAHRIESRWLSFSKGRAA